MKVNYTSFGSGAIVLINLIKEFHKLIKNNQKLQLDMIFF